MWGRNSAVPHELVDGVPVLGGAVAWLACELERELAGGDHTILLGRPLDAGSGPDREPLVFYDGRFHAPAFARAAAVDTGAAGE